MDLKAYYRKIHEIEAALPEEYVVVVSLATQDGGQEGVVYEVNRRVAARLLVEGRARLASEEEAVAFREAAREAHERAKEAEAARKIQISVVSPTAEIRQTRTRGKQG